MRALDTERRFRGGDVVFAVTAFLAAALLFMVQPMAGRLVLPLLGGSPSVWNTCMVFFQCALLAAYGMSHLVVTRFSGWMQAFIVSAFLTACASLPPAAVDLAAPTAGESREVWLVRTLVLTVGIPFFAVATLAPLLQAWLASCGGPGTSRVYSLYAASNAGSLCGLLAYPFAIEPTLTRSGQLSAWTWAFRLLSFLVVACAVMRLRTRAQAAESRNPAEGGLAASPLAQMVRWCMLAAIPSSLMLGVTQQITTDIAAFPMLWVIPLALYLITFILAFSSGPQSSAHFWSLAAVPTSLAAVFLVLAQWKSPMLPVILAHLANFFVLSACCHSALAAEKPPVSSLTTFYFCMSLGGLCGGLFNTLVAPAIFNDVFEYPIAIAAALVVCASMRMPAGAHGTPASFLRQTGWIVPIVTAAVSTLAVVFADRWIRSGGFGGLAGTWLPDAATLLSVAAVWLPMGGLLLAAALRQHRTYALLAGGLLAATAWMGVGRELCRDRSYFGVLRVSADRSGQWHVLTHGSTIHGVQACVGDKRFLPTTYYHPTGPIGQVIAELRAAGRFRRLAVIGLGVGSLAAYCEPGCEADFLEIDDAIVRIAENPALFHYLSDARARRLAGLRIHVVDGRLGIERLADDSLDLLVVDAFSSDAIPIHMMTREAVELFLSKLAPGGLLVFNISSRHFDMRPILADIAAAIGADGWIGDDAMVSAAQRAEAKQPSLWVALSRPGMSPAIRGLGGQGWQPLHRAATGRPCWTDDFSSTTGLLFGR